MRDLHDEIDDLEQELADAWRNRARVEWRLIWWRVVAVFFALLSGLLAVARWL